MTAQDCPPPLAPALAPSKASVSGAGLPPWGRQALLLSAGGLLADLALHGLHGGGSWLGLGALASGWVWLARGHVSWNQPHRPQTVESWRARCQTLLTQFAQLDPDSILLGKRSAALEDLLCQKERKELRLALVSSGPLSTSQLPGFQAALRGPRPLQLMVSDPLPSNSSSWQWSDAFASCDALIFYLRPPLMAADLRWLEALPSELPLWVVMEPPSLQIAELCVADLCSQWPGANPSQILSWDGSPEHLPEGLSPLSRWLAQEGDRIPEATLCRCLEQLHGRWQADLERLRRIQWRQLQERTQWMVAAGVLITPTLSLDLLVLTVANGLMLRDMARLWGCPWSLEQLKSAALHVGQAALALGVVEWSTQAFTSAFKLHGSTWLIGGTLQALSAAYLTRVIGHAMADLLARSVGVSEPDLHAIKAEAPLLVAKAAEAERLDWGAFLQQARSWLRQQDRGPQVQAEGA